MYSCNTNNESNNLDLIQTNQLNEVSTTTFANGISTIYCNSPCNSGLNLYSNIQKCKIAFEVTSRSFYGIELATDDLQFDSQLYNCHVQAAKTSQTCQQMMNQMVECGGGLAKKSGSLLTEGGSGFRIESRSFSFKKPPQTQYIIGQANGENCLNDFECESMECEINDADVEECTLGVCVGERSARVLGESCTIDREIADARYCPKSAGLTCDPEELICIKTPYLETDFQMADLGEVCGTIQSGTICKSGLGCDNGDIESCDNSSCPPDTRSFTCLPRSRYRYDFSCDDDTGECYETALEYQECNSRTKDCFYSQCVAGVCLPFRFLGEECNDMENICRHSQCVLGECRRERRCGDGDEFPDL